VRTQICSGQSSAAGPLAQVLVYPLLGPWLWSQGDAWLAHALTVRFTLNTGVSSAKLEFGLCQPRYNKRVLHFIEALRVNEVLDKFRERVAAGYTLASLGFSMQAAPRGPLILGNL
jgi:hypothetical protein